MSPLVVFASETDSVQCRNIPELTVKAEGTRQTRSAFPLQIISSKEISTLDVNTVSDLARYFAGVTVKDYGGIGGMKTVSLRGLSSQYTGVCYDGVMMDDVQTGEIDLGKFSTYNISQMSVCTGQPSDIFQSARMFSSGGVLMITTKKPDMQQAVSGNVGLKTGSFGMINPAGWIGFRINKKLSCDVTVDALNANGSYKFTQHYGTADNLSEVLTRKNCDVKYLRMETNLRYTFNDKENAGVKINGYFSDRGLPGSVTYYNNYSTDRLYDKNVFVQAYYKNRTSSKFYHQYFFRYNNAYSRFTEADSKYESGILDDRYLQREYYFSASGIYFMNHGFSMSGALDWWRNDLFITSNSSLFSDFPYPVRNTLMGNIAMKYINDVITATGNLLYTHTNESVRLGSPAPNRNKFSPALSVSLRFPGIEGFRVRAFYKNVYRIPTFNDLYYQAMGNPNLLPEDAQQWNIGMTYEKNKWFVFKDLMFTTDFYYNLVKDKIIAIPHNAFQWSMTNKGKVDIKGVDVSAKADIPLSGVSALKLLCNYTFNRAIDITPGNETYGEQIPYTPFNSGSGYIIYALHHFDFGYNMQFSGARWVGQMTQFNSKMPAYIIHSLVASYHCKKWHIKAEAMNLLNEQYAIVQFYPMPGRNYRVSVGYNF